MGYHSNILSVYIISMVYCFSTYKRLLRQLLLFIELMCFFMPLLAQSLSVESFRLLENDMSANIQGTTRTDQNGEVAALIRVVTAERGFVFDGGMIGIVDTKQDVGEILVWVPRGIQRITIKHEQLGVLRDWYFPIPIESARTYELKLLSGRVRTVVEDELTAQFVTFTVEPKNALVYFDGRVYPPSADGTVSQLLTFGSHEYRVEMPGYKTVAGTVQVGAEKIFKDVKLESAMSTITLDCPMAEAEIFLNGESKGTGSWTGELLPAIYQVETRRDGFQTRFLTLTVDIQEVRTVSLPEPLQLYGKLQVKSTPFNATVLLDGEEIGTTPLLKNSVTVAPHRVELRLEGYRNYVTMIEVNETGVTEFEYTLVPDPTWQSVEHKVSDVADNDVTVTEKQVKPQIVKERLPKEKSTKPVLTPTNIYLGGSLFMISDTRYMDLTIGGYFKNLNLEFSFSNNGLQDKALHFHGYWNMFNPVDLNGDGVLDGYASYSYTYRSLAKFNMIIGYGLQFGRRARLTPQTGLIVYTLRNESDQSIYASGESGDRKSYVACMPINLKMEFSPVRHLSLFYTPGFSIPVKMGELAKELDHSNELTDTFKGLTHNIGLQIYF